MANKIGPAIKEARTKAGLTQEKLAKKLTSTSASDISKAERGELELSQSSLKEIAKATGVTQKSLLEAAAASTYKKASGSSSLSGKKSESSSSQTSIKVSSTEKKLIELYRAANSETKKNAMKILKGEEIEEEGDDNLLSVVLNGVSTLLSGKEHGE